MAARGHEFEETDGKNCAHKIFTHIRLGEIGKFLYICPTLLYFTLIWCFVLRFPPFRC